MSQSYTSAFVNKLVTDFQKGEKLPSFGKLKEFVNNNPSDETARYNFAIMCEQLNYKDLAKDHYNKILKKNSQHWRSKFNLYLIYIKEKKYEKALQLANDVLTINSNYQPALRDKAVILYYLKKSEEGLPLIEKSLEQNARDYIALNTLGLIYMDLKQYDLAKKIFKKAISINAQYVPSYNNLGRCYYIDYDRDSAFVNFKKALDLNPQFIEAINNLANYYNETGSYEKAIQFYNQALKLDPKKPELIYNKGLAYFFLGNHKKAEKLYKNAYAIIPNDDQLRKNYSMLLLANQRFKEAWKFFEGRIGLNEFRVKNSQVNRVRKKLWQQENIDKNKKILVIKEQGVGDEIIYSSMYPDLIHKFENLKIETESRLISLFTRSFKKENTFIPYKTYSQSKKELEKFDTILYAGSLGFLFRNDISDFPKSNFLFADKNKCKIMKEKLDSISTKYKIGISWRSGNKALKNYKSLDLTLMSPLLELNQFTFINLQYDYTPEEMEIFNNNSKTQIITFDEIDAFNDFESMSALLVNLDLLITVSNTTTHLAAALGLETWLMKPHNHATFHYWNHPDNQTSWYSNMKLFSFNLGWQKTILEIKKELIKKFN